MKKVKQKMVEEDYDVFYCDECKKEILYESDKLYLEMKQVNASSNSKWEYLLCRDCGYKFMEKWGE